MRTRLVALGTGAVQGKSDIGTEAELFFCLALSLTKRSSKFGFAAIVWSGFTRFALNGM